MSSPTEWDALASAGIPTATTPPPTPEAIKLVAELQEIRSTPPTPTKESLSPELVMGTIILFCIVLIATSFVRSRK